MRDTLKNTLYNDIKFVELDGVAIEDVPNTPGQFTILDSGQLYYDFASKSLGKHLRLGGVAVEYNDETIEDNYTTNSDGHEIYKGISDWDNSGIADEEDYLSSASGEALVEGDIFTETRYISGTNIEDKRYISTTKIKTRTGDMTQIASPAALASETYFEENIKVTEDVGKYKPSGETAGYVELQTAGKSAVEVFKELFQVAKSPSVSYKTVTHTISISTSSGTLTKTATPASISGFTNYGSLSAEKGTLLNSVSINAKYGNMPVYTYGPTIDSTTHVLSTQIGGAVSTTTSDRPSLVTTSSGSNSSARSFSVGFNLTTTEYVMITSQLNWNDSLPKANNNLGDIASPEVKASTLYASGYVTLSPYTRGYYYGYFTNASLDPSSIFVSGNDVTSYMRNLTSSSGVITPNNANFSASNRTFTVPAGTTSVIFAVIAGKTITQIKNTTAGFDDVKGDFTKFANVKIKDASGTNTDAYDVYAYTPVTGAYVNATTFTVYFS